MFASFIATPPHVRIPTKHQCSPAINRMTHRTSQYGVRNSTTVQCNARAFSNQRDETQASFSARKDTAFNDSEIFNEEDDEAAFIINIDDDDKQDVDSASLSQPNGEAMMNVDSEIGEDEFPLDGLTVVDVTAPQKRKKQRRKMTELLDTITSQPQPDTQMSADADSQPDLYDDETIKYVRTAVSAADQRKGDDILALRVSKITYVTSFVVIITGNNTPQLRAISNLIEEDLSKQHALRPRRTDGVPNSGWILLDYGDMLVNIFSAEQRENYNLEKLWSRAEVLDISDWLLEPSQREQPAEIAENTLDDWLADE